MIDKTANSQEWGTPKEVPVKNIPTNRNGRYAAFCEDVLLRLEATSSSAALCYPFKDEETASKFAGKGSATLRKKAGKGGIQSRRAGNLLYIWRGPNWKK